MPDLIHAIQPPKRGFLQFLILKLIYEKPRYGYEILNECRSSIQEDICTKSGTIYTILHRMEKNVLVKSEWRSESKQTSGVRIYEITSEGKIALISGLETLAKRKVIFDQLIFFYHQISNDTPNDIIQNVPKRNSNHILKSKKMNTPKNTLQNTPKKTLQNTPKNTLQNTPKKTLQNTPKKTLQNTPKKTLQNTPKKTLKNTPKKISKNTQISLKKPPQNRSE